PEVQQNQLAQVLAGAGDIGVHQCLISLTAQASLKQAIDQLEAFTLQDGHHEAGEVELVLDQITSLNVQLRNIELSFGNIGVGVDLDRSTETPSVPVRDNLPFFTDLLGFGQGELANRPRILSLG